MRLATHVAGALIGIGFFSIVYTLATGQMSTRRRPAYWLATVMSATLVAIYVDFLSDLLRLGGLFPGWTIRAGFAVAYIILGCLLTLVSWIDRSEHRDRQKAVGEADVRIRDKGPVGG